MKKSVLPFLTDRERLEAYEKMTIFSDVLANAFFRDASITQYILQSVLEQEELEVSEVTTQNLIEHAHGHSVRFDVLVKDTSGDYYDIEIQNTKRDDLLFRADYYGASLKVRYFEKLKEYGEIPKVYVIFFDKHGCFCNGKMVERYFIRDDSSRDSRVGTRIYFVNGALQDDSRVGKIMHDFSCPYADQMYDARIAERFRTVKNEEMSKMDAFSEMIYNRGIDLGEKRGIELGEKRGIELGERRGIELGEKRGIELGEKLGEAKSRRKIALALIKRGMCAEEVSLVTGMRPEEVLHLSQK